MPGTRTVRPEDSAAELETYYTDVPTPIGALRLIGTPEGLGRIALPPERDAWRSRPDWIRADQPFREARRQLAAYFARRLTVFDLPLRPVGTPFQLAVWQALRDIPYGETRSYAELARTIGRPRAVRAVGAANGQNPLPIVIPCHRVIGSDGRLTGYGGGLAAKEALLALEGARLL